MPNIDFPITPTVGQRYTFAGITYVFTAQGVWSPGSTIVTQAVPQGRLTLQTGTPVMTTTSSGHTSLFYSPYLGNKVPFWDGNTMSMRGCAEIMAVTTDFTKNPSPIGPNKVNDWFLWNDVGTLRLSHSPDWTNNITRLDALVRIEGVLLNNVAIVNGPAAQRGTYVGTTYSSANSMLDWIYGGIAVPPVAGFFGLWNMYNRAQVTSQIGDSTASWSYSLAAIREIRGDTSAIFTYVSGMQEDTFSATIFTSATATGGGVLITGVGYDVANAYSGAIGSIPNYNVWGGAAGRFAVASFGKHFMAACESVNADGFPQTVLGANAGAGGSYSGMFFDGRF